MRGGGVCLNVRQSNNRMRRGTGQPGAGTGGEGEVAAEAAAGAVVVASYAPQAADRGRSPAAGCLSANQGITPDSFG